MLVVNKNPAKKIQVIQVLKINKKNFRFLQVQDHNNNLIINHHLCHIQEVKNNCCLHKKVNKQKKKMKDLVNSDLKAEVVENLTINLLLNLHQNPL